MPLVCRSQRVGVDLQGESLNGLIQTRAPEVVAQRREQQRSGFTRDAREGQHAAVITPGIAVRSVMDKTDRQLGTPRPSAASRMECGTISIISSVVRATVGIIMMPSTTPPASAEKVFVGATINP